MGQAKYVPTMKVDRIPFLVVNSCSPQSTGAIYAIHAQPLESFVFGINKYVHATKCPRVSLKVEYLFY
jgi:hypothetical protein